MDTKRRIDAARDLLVGKVPDPKSQVEQITIALIYKFMDDIDAQAEQLGGRRKFFAGSYARFAWRNLLQPNLGGQATLILYAEALSKIPQNPNIPPLFRTLFQNAFLPYNSPETLRAFLKIIHEFQYDHSERLGDAFEYLLAVLGAQGDAGQFRTPRHIIDFIVNLLNPKNTKPSSTPPAAPPASSSPPTNTSNKLIPPAKAATFCPPTKKSASPKTCKATTSRPTWCASP